jgi:hypothetical protein
MRHVDAELGVLPIGRRMSIVRRIVAHGDILVGSIGWPHIFAHWHLPAHIPRRLPSAAALSRRRDRRS